MKTLKVIFDGAKTFSPSLSATALKLKNDDVEKLANYWESMRANNRLQKACKNNGIDPNRICYAKYELVEINGYPTHVVSEGSDIDFFMSKVQAASKFSAKETKIFEDLKVLGFSMPEEDRKEFSSLFEKYVRVLTANTNMMVMHNAKITNFANELVSKLDLQGFVPVKFKIVPSDVFKNPKTDESLRIEIGQKTLTLYVVGSKTENYRIPLDDLKVTKEKIALGNKYIADGLAALRKKNKDIKSVFSALTKSDRKYTSAELEFMAAYFTATNMGLTSGSPKLNGSKVTVAIQGRSDNYDLNDPYKAGRYLFGAVQSLMEDEDQAEGMQEELKSWRKELNKETLAQTGKVHKDVLPILEFFINNGSKSKAPSSAPSKTVSKKIKASKFKLQDRVIAEYDQKWYLGVVTLVTKNQIAVMFDNGDVEKIDIDDPAVLHIPKDTKPSERAKSKKEAMMLANLYKQRQEV